MTGWVYKSTGSYYTVKTATGEVYDCRIKGKFRIKGIKSTNPIAVGDVVDFELDQSTDETMGQIHHIHDRKNYIIRKSIIPRQRLLLLTDFWSLRKRMV